MWTMMVCADVAEAQATALPMHMTIAAASSAGTASTTATTTTKATTTTTDAN